LGLVDVMAALRSGPVPSPGLADLLAALAVVGGLAAIAAVPLLAVDALLIRLRPEAARLRMASGGLMLAGAVAARIANHVMFVRLYPWIHGALTAATLVLLACAWALLAPTAPKPKGPLAKRALGLASLAAVLLAAGQWGLTRRPAVTHALIHRTTDAHHGLKLIMRLLDGDGDGYADAFGGGDCDDSNAAVSPARREIPGNGRDDNCMGGELAAAPPPPPAGAPADPMGAPYAGYDVVLLGIDGLRMDRVAAAGAPVSRVPVLDRWVRDKKASVFTGMLAPSCWTMPSVWSVFTGAPPSAARWTPVGIGEDDSPVYERGEGTRMWEPSWWRKTMPTPVQDRSPNLVEAFKEAGYKTTAIISHPFFRQGFGLTDSFDKVDDIPLIAQSNGEVQDAAGLMTRGAIEALNRHGGPPLFLWGHYLDPHHPRHRHPEVAPELGGSDVERYDAELMRVDAFVGALAQWLHLQGRLDRTVLIVMSDHGEEFRDHGGEFHASSLYGEITRVPLFIRLPGRAGRVIGGRSSLMDLWPTLSALIGIRAGPGPGPGRSLAPWLAPGPGAVPAPPPPHHLLECFRFHNQLRSLVGDHHKLIHDRRWNTVELYDLGRDPAERRNLAGQEPELTQRLLGRLGARVDSIDGAWWTRHGVPPP
jgi:arylsulfatase A-like enzyme